MSEPIWKQLDLERHGRVLKRLSTPPAWTGVCDRDGELVWSSDAAAAGELAPRLAELDASDPDGPDRAELGAAGALLRARIQGVSDDSVGWLVAQLSAQVASADSDALGDALRDVAASISTEYRLQQEVQGLVGELSGRYEELNLVYTLEGQTRSLHHETLGAQALLQNLAEHLEVDLAVLVLPERSDPIYALGSGKRLGNLDLVLTQLRGDVFRFVAIAREALVLNQPRDLRREYLFLSLPYNLVACPVLSGSHVLGMLALVRREDRPEFTNGDRNLTAMVAGQTAVILRNHDMVSRLEKFSAQMASALIEAVEAKDPYTRGHSERVQSISVGLGRTAGLSGLDVEDVSWGALLHDIGKIGIPDGILCKAGRLERDEYTLVKIHPERSYQILRHIENLRRNALDAARHHHERFDGTGYPRGMRGSEIPIHARVVSVADTYDAITSSRAYRPAQSHDFALEQIRRGAGTQLDPRLVQLFESRCEKDPAWLREIRVADASDDG